jgi:hypothetical protein
LINREVLSANFETGELPAMLVRTRTQTGDDERGGLRDRKALPRAAMSLSS